MRFYLPERLASEDDATIAQHIKWMALEKRKKQPDYQQVACALDKTLADRRHWLMKSEPRPKIAEVRNRYPWLFDEDQVCVCTT